MNHYVTSVDNDYGMRDALGDAGSNFLWILKNVQDLDFDEYDLENVSRCLKYKIWEGKMCLWIDSVRTKHDPNYRQLKVRRKNQRIVKSIDNKIASCQYAIKTLAQQVHQLERK